MTVTEIVKAYLEAHGYDGLFNENGECACILADLAPCGEPSSNCEAGYLAPCQPECGDHDWRIQAEKPSVPTKECPACHGSGWYNYWQNQSMRCDHCNGTGKVVAT